MNPFSGMSGLTRNPLGILAIFLGVLYGIAGLLLGASNASLTPFNQTLLTWLVVLFPFVSLGTFAWLVSRHHSKLYSPTDFRSDEGFLGSLRSASVKETEKKLELEADALKIELSTINDSTSPSVDSHKGEQNSKGERTKRGIEANNSENRKSAIRSAEDSVFRELETKYKYIKRNLKLTTVSKRSIVVDGVGWNSGSETTHFIEVTYLARSSTLVSRSREIAFQLNRISHCFPDNYDHRLVCCLIVNEFDSIDESKSKDVVLNSCRDLEMSNVDIFVFKISDDDNVMEVPI